MRSGPLILISLAAFGVAAVAAGDAAALMLQPRAALGAELGQLGLGGGHIGVGLPRICTNGMSLCSSCMA